MTLTGFTVVTLRGAFGGLICGILNLIAIVILQGIRLDNLEQYGVLLLTLWSILLGGIIGGLIIAIQVSSKRKLTFLARFYVSAGVIAFVGLSMLGLASSYDLLTFKSLAAKLGYLMLSLCFWILQGAIIGWFTQGQNLGND